MSTAVPDGRQHIQGQPHVIEDAPVGNGDRSVKSLIAKGWTAVRTDYKLIMLTFELFWIAVFLLDRIGQATTGGVPQFVYVNF